MDNSESLRNSLEVVLKRFQDSYRKRILDIWSCQSDEDRYRRLMETNVLARQLSGLQSSLCFRYENDRWHSVVLDTLDLEVIYANIDRAVSDNKASDSEYEDYLVKELLRYFKRDFFTWCNSPVCTLCGNDSNQQSIGLDRPTPEESQYQCGTVEVYRCRIHNTITRFPRYNDPIKLLQTRTGRCGEWCNLFTLILKSFGLEARYVWNKEDHVWCEYYSKYLKKWVHVDSCEQSYNEPHIYSNNWNKKMSYVIAFSIDTVTDVSPRYILKNQLPRKDISENDLSFLCQYLTKKLRTNMNEDQVFSLACRDEQERLEWIKSKQLKPTKIDSSPGSGRESGSVAWKKERGENGSY